MMSVDLDCCVLLCALTSWQCSLSISDAGLTYILAQQVPMHMPGHKQGSGAHPAARAVLGDASMRHDFTELEGAGRIPLELAHYQPATRSWHSLQP